MLGLRIPVELIAYDFYLFINYVSSGVLYYFPFTILFSVILIHVII